MFNKTRYKVRNLKLYKREIKTHIFYIFIICVLLWALLWLIPSARAILDDISQPYTASAGYELMGDNQSPTFANYTPVSPVVGAGSPTIEYPIATGQMAALTRVCASHGYSEQWCRNTLAGICWAESKCKSEVVGDNGEAIGAFQINQMYHPNTAEQARNFEWAADYTLTRLEKYGFPEMLTYAVSCHNGCGNIAYAEAVKRYATMFN